MFVNRFTLGVGEFTQKHGAFQVSNLYGLRWFNQLKIMFVFGLLYQGGDKEKIVLLNTAQNNVTENLLNTDCRFLSDNIYSLVEYLSTITSNKNMPTGESLAKLILIISETHVSYCKYLIGDQNVYLTILCGEFK